MAEGINILVVDDEPFNQSLLEDMLENLGHTVILASSGEEALEKFGQQQPDFVLMDVMMPGMSGFDTVRAIRRLSDVWVPIIFITSLAEVNDMVQGVQSGGDDYLLKPLNFDLLRAKIDSLHERRLLEKKLSDHNRELQIYRARAVDESQIAQEFIRKVTALDTASDPDVQFHLHPAENYSGDLIAFGRTPSGQLHVMLADSTGHGLAAALNVMPILQPFYAMTAKGFSVGKIATEINRVLKDYLPQHRFVAAIIASVDSESRLVQMWNGGLPPAVLLKEDGMVAHQFDSHNLPLGILGQQEFDGNVEQFFYGGHDCQLFLCSDGAVDTVAPDANMTRGMQALLGGAYHEIASERLQQIWQIVDKHLQGRAALDDIALMMVSCPGEYEDAAEILKSQALANGVAAMQQQREVIAPALLLAEESDWQVELRLASGQLRKADVIPVLLLIVNNMEIQNAKLSSSLFVTVSELFNNALDHGVLQLDSLLKQDPAGMELYFEERAKRLGNLDQGEINISLEKLTSGNNAFLKVTFRDSGEGFDYAARFGSAALTNTEPVEGSATGRHSVLRHGRGIALMQSLCYSLRFMGKGNEVEAILML